MEINMNIQQNMSLMEKLSILTAAAKYDVACTSSGVDRRGNGTGMGNSLACGICHSFSADGRCISLLKILFTNECIFNCAYCQNNCNSDVKRASFTPDEVCELTIEFYRRNYIEGLENRIRLSVYGCWAEWKKKLLIPWRSRIGWQSGRWNRKPGKKEG